MRAIGQLPDEAAARVFGDYLASEKMPHQVEPDDNGHWTVWIHEDDSLGRAEILLKEFRENPKDPKYRRAAAKAEGLRVQEQKEEKAWRKRVHERRTLWPGGPGRVGWVSATLTGLCVAVAVANALLGPENDLIQLLRIRSYAVLDGLVIAQPGLQEIFGGQIWRVVTPIFLHFGVFHLLFNMLWLLDLGSLLENRQSPGRLAIKILLIAAVSNLAQYWWTGSPNFGGMSGVVYGLFGYIWVRGKLDPRCGLQIDSTSVILMTVWFFVCITGAVGPVANMCHGAGLAMGLVWGFAAARLNPGA
jgi:GlpG protein